MDRDDIQVCCRLCAIQHQLHPSFILACANKESPKNTAVMLQRDWSAAVPEEANGQLVYM